MNKEMKSSRSQGAFNLVEQPRKGKIISTKWVFKIKKTLTSEVEKFKARFVARGFTQQPGIDCKETCAPLTWLESLRVILTMTGEKGWNCWQLNIKSAFINIELIRTSTLINQTD